MNNLTKKSLVGLIVVSTLAILSIVTCGGDKGTNPVSFAPGNYKGTYTVAARYQTPDEDRKCDTVIFRFDAPETFRMDTCSDDKDREVCRVYGKYLFGHDSLKLYDINKHPYVETCNEDYAPIGGYNYYTEQGVMIFNSSNADTNRRIELWNKIE